MYEVRMPKMGQTVEEAPIVQWFKSEGDRVAAGDPLFSIQTDKAEVECESPASGVLRKILLEPGVEVPVLTVIALIGEPDEALPDLSQYGVSPGAAPAPSASETPQPVAVSPLAAVSATPAAPAAAAVQAPVSPRARKKAAELGVDAARLAGSGVGGRVIEADVTAAAGAAASVRATPVARRVAAQAGVNLAAVAGTGSRGKIMKDDVLRAREMPATPGPQLAPAVSGDGVRRIPLTPMRRIIAQRMSESKYAAPHYYVTVEVDMGAIKALRERLPFKASFNDLVLFATVRALREFPHVNARWAGDAIEEVADVNLGVAVAMPNGLVVPVVRQAQHLSLEGLAQAAKTLVEKTKTNKLLPDDYTGNTFTVSNMGVFGVESFTAIINQPDSAIIAVGAITDRVVAREGGIHVRPMMKMTMSSDHRVIDGAVAAQFMGRLKQILEIAEFQV
ncbi:MAG TPA: dihydrolipoamide acetyltransferase family protein [Candidatus Hydrogenedentes bacterium]|nr:dihydrolipoamide acetyltransferase family protein [Candidatus Hydrogenedentota bacterium]HNT87190.1 dihydrolipoamide acetyltransferase family protein [Candidatus Hydrogenedentota bacterium]